MSRASLLATLPACILAVFLLFDAESTVLGLFSDDAFYYTKIAQSIVDGHGSTFDGITPTNGYHPLWMLFMVAVRALCGDAVWAPVILTAVLCALLCGVTLLLVHRTVERWAAPGFGTLAVAVCLMPFVLAGMFNGLETGLCMASIALFAWASYRYDLLSTSAGPRSRFVLGLLLGTVFLARLDCAFIVLAAGVLLLAAGLAERTPLRALCAGLVTLVLGVLVLATPYFLWNYATFGHLSPISGEVKSSFPHMRWQLDPHGDILIGLAFLVADVAVAVAVATIDRRRGVSLGRVLASPLSILTLGASIHFANSSLFMAWGVYWWHFVGYGMALALGLPQLVQRLGRTSHAATSLRRPAAVLFAAFGIGGLGWMFTHKLAQHREWLKAAEWTRQNTGPDTVAAMKDAGLFGYFSQRKVINLDGKANGYDYLERIENDTVLDYLEQNKVAYIADIQRIYVDGRSRITVPRVGQAGLALWMQAEDEVYQGEPYSIRRSPSGEARTACIAIWRFARRRPL